METVSAIPLGIADQAQEPDSARLERALHWQAEARRPWRSIWVSIVLHAFLVLPSFLAAILGAEPPAPPERKETVTQIFVPAPGAPPQPEKVPAANAPDLRKVPPEGPAVPDVSVNLRSLQLHFAPDVRNQLPAVIRSQHGMLALLDAEDSGIAHYLIEPPDWVAREDIVDVSGKLRILMDPPESWPIFRQIAQRYGIELRRYRASAVFDIAYRRCLQDAIHSRAVSDAKSGRVSGARLAFVADRPCGVEVLEVSLAANPPSAP